MKHGTMARLRILIVDGNHHMRTLLRSMLYSAGARLVLEEGGEEAAFDRVDGGQVDVIIADVKLSQGNGLNLLRRVRKDSAYPETGFIFLTGDATERMVVEALQAGVDEFLVKPVSPATITRRLVDVVERPRPFVKKGDYFGPAMRPDGKGTTKIGLIGAPVFSQDLIAA